MGIDLIKFTHTLISPSFRNSKFVDLSKPMQGFSVAFDQP